MTAYTSSKHACVNTKSEKELRSSKDIRYASVMKMENSPKICQLLNNKQRLRSQQQCNAMRIRPGVTAGPTSEYACISSWKMDGKS